MPVPSSELYQSELDSGRLIAEGLESIAQTKMDTNLKLSALMVFEIF
jgi:hypothetical protein